MADIDDALRRIDDAVAEGRDGVAEDVAFHRTIAAVTGNPYFLKTLQFLNQYLEAGVKVTRRNEATREDFAGARGTRGDRRRDPRARPDGRPQRGAHAHVQRRPPPRRSRYLLNPAAAAPPLSRIDQG